MAVVDWLIVETMVGVAPDAAATAPVPFAKPTASATSSVQQAS